MDIVLAFKLIVVLLLVYGLLEVVQAAWNWPSHH
jgi:hypothetical protein